MTPNSSSALASNSGKFPSSVEAVTPNPVKVEPQSVNSAISEEAKQEFLWHTHEYLNEYARYGDTKAAFAGAIASGLLGVLYRAGEHKSVLNTPFYHWAFVAYLGALASLLIAIALSLLIVLPRLRSTQSKGFIYWQNIAEFGEAELLQTSFHSQSARSLNDHLLHHLFDISTRVCVPKYHKVSICIVALGIGGVLATAALILQNLPLAF
jgi:hypothetical protein